jgi:hypothetical protein
MTKGTLQFNNEWVYANFEDWSVYGRVLEIKDPIDFENLIKKTIKTKPTMVAVPPVFSEALSRARVLADPESQKTSLSINKSRGELLTETHMGEIRDSVPLKGHDDVTCSINASHIQRCLSHCDTFAFTEQCTILEKGSDIFMLVSNMG